MGPLFFAAGLAGSYGECFPHAAVRDTEVGI